MDELDGSDAYRWFQIIKCLDLEKNDLHIADHKNKNIALLGFACDEGVRRNKGRAGAAKGPRSLRQALSNLTDHFPGQTQLVDMGDIVCQNENMEAAQSELAFFMKNILDKNYFPILMGGGHEIAYGHFKGIANHQNSFSQKKIGIINLDAHFDVRSFQAAGNSGTPFLQIAEECEKLNVPFNYMALGIQPASNTKMLFQTAERLNVNFLTVKDLFTNSRDNIKLYLNDFISAKDYIYLTICLDVFAAPFAPGVSAPAANGLYPDVVFFLIDHIFASQKVISCDIAELNPEYDIDNRTAKLAAALVYNVVEGITENQQKEIL